MTEHLSKEIGVTAEATNRFDRIDDQHKGSWHLIGDLAKIQLATLALQMTVAQQGNVFHDRLQCGKAAMSRAA
jgi:hypothetical protein